MMNSFLADKVEAEVEDDVSGEEELRNLNVTLFCYVVTFVLFHGLRALSFCFHLTNEYPDIDLSTEK